MESITESGHCPDWLESCFANDDKSSLEEFTNHTRPIIADKGPEERKGTYVRLKKASRPHSTPLTLKWLEENYELAEGVCIPRSTLYVHYLDFCEKHDTQPVNAASFGKIIRQQFPQLTTRRLGTRGQSKYHYYGIGVRETSEYYDIVYSAKGVQGSMDGKKDASKQIIAYSPRSKLGTLLPDFPDIKDIKLPPTVAEDKVLTFMMMYRTHCQRILDTVIRANFDEVQSFLIHFWQGMPNHMKSILECKVLVTLVGVCDTILYRAIAGVLMPTVIQPLPESLTQVIRRFSGQLDDWLHQALDTLPQSLQKVKFDLARRFSQVLRRQTSLNHLCQAARTVVHSPEITSQMLDDWCNVDLNSIIKQTLYTMDSYSDKEHNVIVKLTQEFEILLEEQAPLESYVTWLDGMVDQCVVQKGNLQLGTLRKTARQFLLMWSCFGTRIIRDMTLHSAPSFGSFHLLHLMFDEYVLYMVETLHCQERGNELLRAVRGEQNLDFLDDIVTADTATSTVDRSSVIRGPNTTPQHTEDFENLLHFNSLDARESCTTQHTMYKESGEVNAKLHGIYRESSYPSSTFCNQYGYTQCQNRSSNNNNIQLSNNAALKSPSSMQPFLGGTKQMYSGSDGSTVSNWYDWTSRSISCTGLPGHVPSRLSNTEPFHRPNMSATFQNIPNQIPVNYDNNSGTTCYVSCNDDSLRRTNSCSDDPLLKRKLQDVSLVQNKQFDNFCSYNNMGTNLL